MQFPPMAQSFWRLVGHELIGSIADWKTALCATIGGLSARCKTEQRTNNDRPSV
jgi:hypothetical protein